MWGWKFEFTDSTFGGHPALYIVLTSPEGAVSHRHRRGGPQHVDVPRRDPRVGPQLHAHLDPMGWKAAVALLDSAPGQPAKRSRKVG